MRMKAVVVEPRSARSQALSFQLDYFTATQRCWKSVSPTPLWNPAPSRQVHTVLAATGWLISRVGPGGRGLELSIDQIDVKAFFSNALQVPFTYTVWRPDCGAGFLIGTFTNISTAIRLTKALMSNP